MYRAANTPDKSNKILLRAMKTAALEVIKYYCPGSFTPGSQKLLESMRKHRGQSQAQAESQSQAQAQSQAGKQRDSLKHTINAQAQSIANAQARRLPAHAA